MTNEIERSGVVALGDGSAAMVEIDGREYRKFIPYPEEITDGTLRCISCGQIDEEGYHDPASCPACDMVVVSTTDVDQNGEHIEALIPASELAGHDGQCPRPCNGRPDDFSMRQCIEAGECGCVAFPAQEPVAYRAADPDGDGYIYLDRDKTVDVYRNAGVQFTPLYAAPQPVINPTHSQVAGTPGLLTDPAPSEHVEVVDRFAPISDQQIREIMECGDASTARIKICRLIYERTKSSSSAPLRHRLRRIVERRDEFIIGKSFWNQFKEVMGHDQ